MTLIYLAIAWMLGIIAADLLPLSPVVLQAAAALGALFAAVCWRRPRLRLIGLLHCCATLGGWRYGATQRPPTAQDVRLLRGRGILTLDGFVQGDPKRTDDGQQVILAVQAARIGARPRPAEG